MWNIPRTASLTEGGWGRKKSSFRQGHESYLLKVRIVRAAKRLITEYLTRKNVWLRAFVTQNPGRIVDCLSFKHAFVTRRPDIALEHEVEDVALEHEFEDVQALDQTFNSALLSTAACSVEQAEHFLLSSEADCERLAALLPLPEQGAAIQHLLNDVPGKGHLCKPITTQCQKSSSSASSKIAVGRHWLATWVVISHRLQARTIDRADGWLGNSCKTAEEVDGTACTTQDEVDGTAIATNSSGAPEYIADAEYDLDVNMQKIADDDISFTETANRHWRQPVSDGAGHGCIIVEVKRRSSYSQLIFAVNRSRSNQCQGHIDPSWRTANSQHVDQPALALRRLTPLSVNRAIDVFSCDAYITSRQQHIISPAQYHSFRLVWSIDFFSCDAYEIFNGVIEILGCGPGANYISGLTPYAYKEGNHAIRHVSRQGGIGQPWPAIGAMTTYLRVPIVCVNKRVVVEMKASIQGTGIVNSVIFVKIHLLSATMNDDTNALIVPQIPVECHICMTGAVSRSAVATFYLDIRRPVKLKSISHQHLGTRFPSSSAVSEASENNVRCVSEKTDCRIHHFRSAGKPVLAQCCTHSAHAAGTSIQEMYCDHSRESGETPSTHVLYSTEQNTACLATAQHTSPVNCNAGAAPECKGVGNGRSLRQSGDQHYRTAQFTHAKLGEQPFRVLNPVHLDEPDSIPGRVTPGYSHVGNVPDDATGRRGSPVYPALSFRYCSIRTSITHVGSQDVDVKSRLNLFPLCSLAHVIGQLHLETPFANQGPILNIPAYLQRFSAFQATNYGSDKDDASTGIKCAITTNHKAPN
ncbi:hypothetical protein PR048_001885 [Dryococelus australis]|uniref:Uncharacterized protein n=1 Tax=Dryococelus australis TaxID=614101 RepID=A0ABQ9IJP6_9NEOP|nr:hypothetical protein PR048_001885 [Dryococelus australis]